LELLDERIEAFLSSKEAAGQSRQHSLRNRMKPHRGGSARHGVKSHSPFGGFKHQAAPQQHKHHVSLQRFAQGKVNTSHKKAEEAEVARHKKAAALRKYAKLCKREGIVSDRVNTNAVSSTKSDHDQDKKQLLQQKQQQKRDGQHSFSSAQQEAQAAKDSKALKELERQQVQKEIKESEKVRKQKRRETLVKTKKGQPVLNNLVTKLLSKIQGSKAAADSK